MKHDLLHKTLSLNYIDCENRKTFSNIHALKQLLPPHNHLKLLENVLQQNKGVNKKGRRNMSLSSLSIRVPSFKQLKRILGDYVDAEHIWKIWVICRIIGRARKTSHATALSPKKCDFLHLSRSGGDGGGAGAGRNHHGSPQALKGSAQETQDPGHLLKAVGQTVQISSQSTNTTFNQVVLKSSFKSHTNWPAHCPFP